MAKLKIGLIFKMQGIVLVKSGSVTNMNILIENFVT
jgi:hypothetical protein